MGVTSQHGRVASIVIAMVLLVAVPVVFIKPYDASMFDIEAWKAGFEILRQKFGENYESDWFWSEAVFSIVLPAFFALGLYCESKQRLVVDGRRIYDTMPLLKIFRPFGTALDVGIDEIASAELRRSAVGAHVEPYRLVLTTRQGHVHRILPFKWIDETTVSPPHRRAGLFHSSKKPEFDDPYRTAIVGALIQRGVKITSEEPSSRSAFLTFDVSSSKSSMAAFIVGVSLGGYTFADMATTRLAYLDEPPYLLFAMTGIIVGLISGLLLKRAQVPGHVRLGLGAFLAVAAGFASYPGALRVNDLLVDEAPQLIPYEVQLGYMLHAVEGDWSDIIIKNSALWPVLPVGERYTMSIRKGGLNIYYVELSPIYNQAWEHYNSGGDVLE